MIRRIINKINRIFFVLFNRPFYGALGNNSIIDKPLMIENKKNIFIGNKCLIRGGARLTTVPYWYINGKKEQSYSPKLVIEDNVSIEQNVHINCANSVRIEKDCTLSSYVFITDVDHSYENINEKVLNQPLITYETVVGEGTFLGTGVKVMAGVKIGKHCVIGANAVVSKDIPDYSVAVGIPARVIKLYNFENKTWQKV